jgi:hypothetical protein
MAETHDLYEEHLWSNNAGDVESSDYSYYIPLTPPPPPRMKESHDRTHRTHLSDDSGANDELENQVESDLDDIYWVEVMGNKKICSTYFHEWSWTFFIG